MTKNGRRFLPAAALWALLLPQISLDHASATEAVGQTPGEAEGTPSGDAGYRITLTLPPGIDGLQPAWALTYRRRTGNALLGMGWSLDGFSEIRRCRQTLAQSGAISAVSIHRVRHRSARRRGSGRIRARATRRPCRSRALPRRPLQQPKRLEAGASADATSTLGSSASMPVSRRVVMVSA